MRNTKYGPVETKEERRIDTIKGIRKYLEVGMFNQVYLLEKVLMSEYGMTAEQIENEVYA